MAVGTSLGLGYALLAPKTWRSTARVLVDPRDKQVVGQGLTQPIQGTDPAWVATQASLVTAEATLSRVVDGLGLDKNPDFGGSRDEAIRHLAELIEVDRADETYVLDVNVTTKSPTLSASLAGALSDAYVASIVDAKADSVRQATALLGRQIDDLRTKSRDAELALQAYKSENNLVAASGRMVDEERLRQLNEAFVAASVRAQELKARSDRLTAAVKAGRNAVDSALETADSAVLNRLKIEYALAQRSAAELARDLGPSHPRMQAVEANIDRTRGPDPRRVAFARLHRRQRHRRGRGVRARSQARARRRDRPREPQRRRGRAPQGTRERGGRPARDVPQLRLAHGADGAAGRNPDLGRQGHPAGPGAAEALFAETHARGHAGLRGRARHRPDARLYRGRGDLVVRPARPIAPPVPVPASPAIAEAPKRPRDRLRRKPLAEIFDSLRDEPVPETPPPPSEPVVTRAADPEPPRTVEAALVAAAAPEFARAAGPAASDATQPADLIVLAEVDVDTAPRMTGRSGRMLVRSAREILASAVEDGFGGERAAGLTAMTILADRLAETGDRPTVTAVFGAAVGSAANAVAYGIARGSVAAGRGVLMVDATADAGLAAALCGRAAPVLLDLPDDPAQLIDAPPAVDDGFDVVAAARAGETRLVAEADRLARRIERLAAGYRHVVVALDSDPDFDLMAICAGSPTAPFSSSTSRRRRTPLPCRWSTAWPR